MVVSSLTRFISFFLYYKGKRVTKYVKYSKYGIKTKPVIWECTVRDMWIITNLFDCTASYSKTKRQRPLQGALNGFSYKPCIELPGMNKGLLIQRLFIQILNNLYHRVIYSVPVRLL